MLDRLINILVIVTLIEMMAVIGLAVSFADVLQVFRNWRLTAGAVAANYLLVPAATVGLLLVFAPDPLVAVGFLVVAACPGAPYGPVLTKVAKGDVPRSVGVMVLLSSTSAILAPLLLRLLAPIVAADSTIRIDVVRIVRLYWRRSFCRFASAWPCAATFPLKPKRFLNQQTPLASCSTSSP